MSGWRAVTFYTLETGYAKEVQKLRASAEALGIPLDEYAYPSLGTWRKNLNYKSYCILEAMKDHPDEDIVFIDADAVIRKRPEFFDYLSARDVRVLQYDLAAHYFKWRETSKFELLSGTLWVANTERGREIIRSWDIEGRLHPEVRHQRCLQRVVEALAVRGRALVYRLPLEYTCIFDAPARKGLAPVIEHFQASRKYRHRLSRPAPHRQIGRLVSAGMRFK